MIVLVGLIGVGKIIIVNLFIRFYDIDRGEIFIDGINIRKIKREFLRKSFGIVF